MTAKTRALVSGGMIAALYVLLTLLQHLIWPGSTGMAIQLRLSEALCVLACFTPSAIPGLAIGCLLANLLTAQGLPFDWLIGTAATALAAALMFGCRRVCIGRIPVLALLMPPVVNALLIGWELTLWLGKPGLFWVQAACVFVGEATVMAVPGTLLYLTLARRGRMRLF